MTNGFQNSKNERAQWSHFVSKNRHCHFFYLINVSKYNFHYLPLFSKYQKFHENARNLLNKVIITTRDDNDFI